MSAQPHRTFFALLVLQATVILHFADNDWWEVEELRELTGIGDIETKLNFWVQNGILSKNPPAVDIGRPVKEGETIYVINQVFGDAALQVSFTWPSVATCVWLQCRPTSQTQL